MRSNKFVEKFGWFAAEDYLAGCAIVDNHLMVFTNVKELKRLVKSHKLVESYGGLEAANRVVCNAYKGSNYDVPKGHEELSLAIQDVESCM